MIKSLKRFDDMTLYEMRECFEEGSKNHTCLDKAIKFRIELGLDHLTNRQYLEYCKRNRKFMRAEIKEKFGEAFVFKTYAHMNIPLKW